MAKAILKTGKLTYNSIQYGVTEMRVSKTTEDVDVTDTASSTNEKEFLSSGRFAREVTVTLWKNVNAANLVIGTAYTATLSFENFIYSGSLVWTSLEDVGTIDGAVQQTYTGRFTGTVSETPAA